MPFFIIKEDLLKIDAEAIVNAANVNLKMVEGVGRAIFHAAGDLELTKACKEIGRCEPGDAVMTPSFNLTKYKMIIHAVAPIYQNGKHREEALLRSAYRKTLDIATENNIQSICFPLLGAKFNWDTTECFRIASEEITNYLHEKNHNLLVYLAMFKEMPSKANDPFQEKLSKFIVSHYKSSEGGKLLSKMPIDFRYTWNRFNKGISDEELMYRANIGLKTINEIKNNPNYKPNYCIVLALGFALHLDENDMKLFLRDFNIKVTTSTIFDLILTYFITNNLYDVYKINECFFIYDLPLLGENNDENI